MNEKKDIAAVEKKGPGRPRRHESAAARQKAYRQRLKERGMRTISRVMRDVRDDVPPRSDIIDLSECREVRYHKR